MPHIESLYKHNHMKHLVIILIVFIHHTTITGQILNGSFENDSSPDLINWEWRCSAESDSSTPPDGGNWSIYIPGGHLQGCFPNYAYQKIPSITNGQTFLLSGLALGETAQLYFGKINSGIKTFLTGSLPASSSWTSLSVQSTFSLDLGDTAIVILSVGTTGGSNFLFGYFDLISLELVPVINFLEQDKSLKLYPNPFNNKTTLKTDKFLHNATLTLKDTFGQTVKQIRNINGQTIILKKDNLATGIYFVQLSEKNEIIASRKLIITN